jgi:hypothetical protein
MKTKLSKQFVFLFITVLVLSGFYNSAQSQNKNLNEFFILGTLSDYKGRTLDPKHSNLIDRYYPSEGIIVAVVDSLINANYPGNGYKSVEKARTTITSDSLAIRLNAYYDFKPSRAYTARRVEYLKGTLKNNIFQNEQEKLAFLAGVFFRFGSIPDSTYRIIIANSTSKAKICSQLLKEFGCQPYYNIHRDIIPFGHVISFHPSPKVLAYLKRYELLDKRLKESMQKRSRN